MDEEIYVIWLDKRHSEKTCGHECRRRDFYFRPNQLTEMATWNQVIRGEDQMCIYSISGLLLTLIGAMDYTRGFLYLKILTFL